MPGRTQMGLLQCRTPTLFRMPVLLMTKSLSAGRCSDRLIDRGSAQRSLGDSDLNAGATLLCAPSGGTDQFMGGCGKSLPVDWQKQFAKSPHLLDLLRSVVRAQSAFRIPVEMAHGGTRVAGTLSVAAPPNSGAAKP